jgi:hypothetical protein
VAAGAGAVAYRPAAPTTAEQEPARVTREAEDGAGPPVGFLQKYRVKDGEVEAGFMPYKTEVVLGEPIAVTFQVKNLSDRPFQYLFGGDYRGLGRHRSWAAWSVLAR